MKRRIINVKFENDLNGNGMSLQFEAFARLAGTSSKGSSVVS